MRTAATTPITTPILTRDLSSDSGNDNKLGDELLRGPSKGQLEYQPARSPQNPNQQLPARRRVMVDHSTAAADPLSRQSVSPSQDLSPPFSQKSRLSRSRHSRHRIPSGPAHSSYHDLSAAPAYASLRSMLTRASSVSRDTVPPAVHHGAL
jgi:hypothetical protein